MSADKGNIWKIKPVAEYGGDLFPAHLIEDVYALRSEFFNRAMEQEELAEIAQKHKKPASPDPETLSPHAPS